MEKPDKHLYPSVHEGIVRAALIALAAHDPDAASRFSVTDAQILVSEAAAPDRIGDRQQGRGMHYYCAVTPEGETLPAHPLTHSFCNGKHRYAPSPLTMLDAEYRAALALNRAGKRQAAMRSLSRAMHMLADICCPPHSCGLTYFSHYAYAHKRYEARAAELFRGCPEQDWAAQIADIIPEYKGLLRGTFPDKDGTWHAGTLTEICNALARSGAEELPAVLGDDKNLRDRSIVRRLRASVANCTALLSAFDRDMREDAPCIWREHHPYWLKSVGTAFVVSKEPLYLEFADDGAVKLSTQDGRFLAVSRLGSVYLTSQTAGLTTSFRFGREPLLTLYPDGDQTYLLSMSRGSLHCVRRSAVRRSTGFSMQTAFVLANQPPAHARFVFRGYEFL